MFKRLSQKTTAADMAAFEARQRAWARDVSTDTLRRALATIAGSRLRGNEPGRKAMELRRRVIESELLRRPMRDGLAQKYGGNELVRKKC